MPFRLLDRCRFLSTTVGTGNIAVGSALIGHQTPAQAGVNNGDTFNIVIEDGANWEIANVTYSTTGPTLTRNYTLRSTNSNAAISLSGSALVTMTMPAVDSVAGEHIPGLISGLTISATGADAYFTVAPGVATSEDGGPGLSGNPARQAIFLPSSMNKLVTSLWSAGAGGGALDTGSFANTRWYHVYVIGPDVFHPGNPTDLLMSASAPPTGPAMPSGYARWRRIGSVRITSGNLVWNVLQQGDYFWLPGIINDYSNNSLSSGNSGLSTFVPSGVSVQPLLSVEMALTTGGIFAVNDAPMGGGITQYLLYNSTTGTLVMLGAARPLTNTSGTFYVNSNVAVTGYYQWTGGYIDKRGKGDFG